MPLQHLFVRHIVWYFAQPIHIVGKCNKACLHLIVGQYTERMAHHGRAGDLAEGTDMRKSRGTVTGLEDDLVLGMFLEPRDNLARLFEWPGIRLLGQLTEKSGGFRRRPRVSGGRALEMAQRPLKSAIQNRRAGEKANHRPGSGPFSHSRNSAQLNACLRRSLPRLTTMLTPSPKKRLSRYGPPRNTQQFAESVPLSQKASETPSPKRRSTSPRFSAKRPASASG